MTEPTIGNWYVVTSGPHRGKRGVCDLVDPRPNGTFYRITNRTEIVGRFPAGMLASCDNPASEYVSQVSEAAQQTAMDMLMERRVS